jgi:energy-coupling factor transporter transmembrane protein EcfT
MMVELPFDRELELVKLQIAANDCLADAQVNIPLYFGSIIVLFVLEITVLTQLPPRSLASVVLTSIVFVLILVFVINLFWTRGRYRDGMRKLNGYVDDFRASEPLPPLTTLCGIKEKKE